jgi:hypothetical protein
LRMLDIERIYFSSPILDYSPADWSPVNVVNGCSSPIMSVEMSRALIDILSFNVNVDCSSFKSSPIKRRYEPNNLDRKFDGFKDFCLTPWSVKANMVKHHSESALAVTTPDFPRERRWLNGMPLVHFVSQHEYRSLPRAPGETSNLVAINFVEMYVDDSQLLTAAEGVEDNVSVDTASKQRKDVADAEDNVSTDTASNLAQSELYRGVSQLFKDVDIEKELAEQDSAVLHNPPERRNRNHLLAHKVPSKPNAPSKRRAMSESGPTKKVRKSNFVSLIVKIQSIPSARIARVPFPHASTRVKTNTTKGTLSGKVKAAQRSKGFPWLESRSHG